VMSNQSPIPPAGQAGGSAPGGDPSVPGRFPDQDSRLLTIFELAKILVTEHDQETMLHKFLSTLIQTLVAADAGFLVLYDPHDGLLKLKAAQGYDSAQLAHMHLAPGESMTGRAFETGRPGLYATPETVAEGMRTLKPANTAIFTAATIGLGRPQSAACIPLISDDKKAGVLVLENLRQTGSFTQADLIFLQHVADLITLSIENMALKEQLGSIQAHSEANRLKAELISTLAHEMRTPLTSIKGYSTALLMEDADFSSETQREFLHIIDEECDILQDLIHDLLESSLIDAGFLKLELEPVMLPRLVKGVVDDIARRSPEDRFLVDLPQDLPILDADPHRIIQVLRNLLDNAVKYSQAGGLVVVRAEVRADVVVVSVADQGIGIAPEHLNRLFEKFFRIKSGLGRHVVGVGLGLPIARAIVESHGGNIWAESQVGQGTTLYFTLPYQSGARPEGRVA
jgi:signal transduction histidine kinase